jgi:hypothetical protein
MHLVGSLLVVIACKGPAKPEPATPWGPIPGLMWTTDAQPWRLPHAPNCIAIGGDVALVGGDNGWLTWVDLRFGTVVRDRRVGSRSMTIHDVARLGYGRWLVVGTDGPVPHATVIAYVLDDETLQATPIALGVKDDPGSAAPQIAVLGDGAVVITGRGLPLAIYDPATWTVRTVLDPALGWGRVSARGTALVAERKLRAHRFELASREHAPLASSPTSHLAVGDTIVATRSSATGDRAWHAELHAAGKPLVRLPDPIDALAIDGTGTQLVTAIRGQLRVHALPSGEITKRIDLGDRGIVSRIEFAGARALLFTSGVLRVVDLDAGTVTPIGPPPYRVSTLAVAGDGTVLAFGSAVWQIASGKIVATEPLGDARVRATRADDIRHYATTRGDAKAIELRTFRSSRTARWILPGDADRQWIASDGGMVFDVAVADFDGLVRTRGNELVNVLRRNEESEVLDVDPDGDALIALEGRVAVADTRDGKPRSSALRMPGCEKLSAFGVVETRGTRAATYNADEVAVWDRTTGKLVASARFDSRPHTVLFVPKTSELILVADDRLVLWTPARSTRTLAITGITFAAISADARGLGLAFHDGRVGYVDLALLRDNVPSGPNLPSATIPHECSKRDPLAHDPPDDAPEAKPEAKPETKPEAKPETKPEAKPETKPQAKPETTPATKPVAKPAATPATKPELEPAAKPETKPETKPADAPDPG